MAGFFKGMSFPLASITVYNSLVFGFFSNTQRLISKYRYGDERQACGMLDLTVASALTGLMSVGLGAPVDLVKIRLQMQTQTVVAGVCVCVCVCLSISMSVCLSVCLFRFFSVLSINPKIVKLQTTGLYELQPMFKKVFSVPVVNCGS